MLDLDATTKIEFYAFVWLALLLRAAARAGSAHGSSVGLPLAFIMSYTYAYGGALIHLVDGFDPTMSPYLRGLGYTRETVAEGLEASCLGMFGASLGFVVADQWKRGVRAVSKLPSAKLREAAVFLLIVGGGFTITTRIMTEFGLSVEGIQAVLSTIRNLLVIGSCGFVYYKLRHGGERQAIVATAFFALLTPVFLLVTTAILADSVSNAILIVSFYLAFRNKGRNSIGRNAVIVIALMCFSFVVASAYLQSRQVLRAVVWGGGGVVAAAQTAVQLARNFDLDSATNNDTLALLDARLNQSIFVGLAIQHLRAGATNFEEGATIRLALLGWVPRFLWPGKPERGGSAFLAKHTGLVFSQGTTFGAGSVFEFYVNFGYTGVLIGFIVLGFIIRRLDIAAFGTLRSGALGGFAQYMLVGVVLLGPLADLFFLVTSVAVGAILGFGLRVAWSRRVPVRLCEATA